jgi:hypothetical protein
MRSKNSSLLCGEGGKDRFENYACSSRGPPNSLFRFRSTEEVLGCEASETFFFGESIESTVNLNRIPLFIMDFGPIFGNSAQQLTFDTAS